MIKEFIPCNSGQVTQEMHFHSLHSLNAPRVQEDGDWPLILSSLGTVNYSICGAQEPKSSGPRATWVHGEWKSKFKVNNSYGRWWPLSVRVQVTPFEVEQPPRDSCSVAFNVTLLIVPLLLLELITPRQRFSWQ